MRATIGEERKGTGREDARRGKSPSFSFSPSLSLLLSPSPLFSLLSSPALIFSSSLLLSHSLTDTHFLPSSPLLILTQSSEAVSALPSPRASDFQELSRLALAKVRSGWQLCYTLAHDHTPLLTARSSNSCNSTVPLVHSSYTSSYGSLEQQLSLYCTSSAFQLHRATIVPALYLPFIRANASSYRLCLFYSYLDPRKGVGYPLGERFPGLVRSPGRVTRRALASHEGQLTVRRSHLAFFRHGQDNQRRLQPTRGYGHQNERRRASERERNSKREGLDGKISA